MSMTSQQSPANPAVAPKSTVRSSWPIYVGAALIAGVVGGFISLFFLADSLAALGIPDPGRLTTFGLPFFRRSEEHTSELQSRGHLVCRRPLEKKIGQKGARCPPWGSSAGRQ